MKKLILGAILTFSMIGCSSAGEDTVIMPDPIPVHIIEKLNVPDALLKPAVRLTNKSILTGKSTSSDKKLVRSLQIATIVNEPGVSVNNEYRINMAIADYEKLPTDNLYDEKEDSLNAGTYINEIIRYEYNDLDQASKRIWFQCYYNENHQLVMPKTLKEVNTSENSVLEAGRWIQATNYTYKSDGNIGQASGGVASYFVYNNKGLITEQRTTYGGQDHYYSYDTLDRVVMDSVRNVANHNFPVEVCTSVNKFEYPEEGKYVIRRSSTNNGHTVFQAHSVTTVMFDKTKAGVFKKEPMSKIDNSYLHVTNIRIDYYSLSGDGTKIGHSETSPKYFYNKDGYLRKYDSGGRNAVAQVYLYQYK